MQSDRLTFEFKDKRLPTITLSQESVAMPITQLQIPISSGLKSNDSVGDALQRLQASGCSDELDSNALRHLANACAADGTVNWLKYWKSREFRFKHLRMKCDELDRLALAHPFQPVDRDSFGKAGITLSKNGVNTLSLLVEGLAEGLPRMAGFGKLKTDELFSRLAFYIKRQGCGEPVFEGEATSDSHASETGVGAAPIDYGSLEKLSSEALALPLRAIHLEKKSKTFTKSGLGTLGGLAEVSKRGIPSMRGVGKETIRRAKFVLSAISASVDEDGEIDWASFATHAKIPTIPADTLIPSGKEFIKLLPSVSDELIAATKDQVERDIFLNRLTRKRSEQKTLEQLGNGIGVTRERIRQKEKILLHRLSDALLYNEYPTLEYRFSADFSQYFKQAASTFREEEQDITFERFLMKLEEAWEVPKRDILPHMALITAILSLKAVKPPDLRVDRAVPITLWDNIPETVATKPLIELPLGKGVADFQDAGIETLGKAIESLLRIQFSVSEQRKSYQRLKRILVNVADALNDGNQETSVWLRFANREGMEILPLLEPESPEHFLQAVHEVVYKVICANSRLEHSSKIFKLRTSKPKSLRYTLKEASDAIGTCAPTVKRTETDFVKMLNSQLIEKDFTESKVFFRKGFLKYWHQASKVYHATREFAHFKVHLEREWQLAPSTLDEHADMIWTILNIYPHGRNLTRTRRKKVMRKDSETDKSTTTGVIRLRGFRRIH